MLTFVHLMSHFLILNCLLLPIHAPKSSTLITLIIYFLKVGMRPPLISIPIYANLTILKTQENSSFTKSFLTPSLKFVLTSLNPHQT